MIAGLAVSPFDSSTITTACKAILIKAQISGGGENRIVTIYLKVKKIIRNNSICELNSLIFSWTSSKQMIPADGSVDASVHIMIAIFLGFMRMCSE